MAVESGNTCTISMLHTFGFSRISVKYVQSCLCVSQARGLAFPSTILMLLPCFVQNIVKQLTALVDAARTREDGEVVPMPSLTLKFTSDTFCKSYLSSLSEHKCKARRVASKQCTLILFVVPVKAEI